MSKTNLSGVPAMTLRDNSRVRPLGDRVMLEVEAGAEKTASGLHLPSTDRERALIGRVLAFGEKVPAGALHTGDRVIFERYGGTEIKPQGDVAPVLVLEYGDIMAVLDGSAQ